MSSKKKNSMSDDHRIEFEMLADKFVDLMWSQIEEVSRTKRKKTFVFDHKMTAAIEGISDVLNKAWESDQRFEFGDYIGFELISRLNNPDNGIRFKSAAALVFTKMEPGAKPLVSVTLVQ